MTDNPLSPLFSLPLPYALHVTILSIFPQTLLNTSAVSSVIGLKEALILEKVITQLKIPKSIGY